jgi:hypothetical protein
MTTVHGTLTTRAAHATACAWFPADTVMSPRARFASGSESTRFNAPRGLNEPVFCRLSTLSTSDTPARSPRARALRTGVRSRWGSILRAAARMFSSGMGMESPTLASGRWRVKDARDPRGRWPVGSLAR